MKRILTFCAVAIALFLSGCAKINPRMEPKIDNQGNIEDMKNNQNGIIAEVGKLRQQQEIQNSQLKEVQQGLLNLSATVSKNENSGVQILQGDGVLVTIFGLGIAGILAWYYRNRAIKSEKATEIMANEVAKFNHPELNDNILKSAMTSNIDKHVYTILDNQIKSLKRNS